MPRNSLEGNTGYDHSDDEPQSIGPTAEHREKATEMLAQSKAERGVNSYTGAEVGNQAEADGANGAALIYGQQLVAHGIHQGDEKLVAAGLAALDHSVSLTKELAELANGEGNLAQRLEQAERFTERNAGAVEDSAGNTWSMHDLMGYHARHEVAIAELIRLADTATTEFTYEQGGDALTDAAVELIIHYAIACGHSDEGMEMVQAAVTGDVAGAAAARDGLEYITVNTGRLAYELGEGISGTLTYGDAHNGEPATFALDCLRHWGQTPTDTPWSAPPTPPLSPHSRTWCTARITMSRR